jgi:hypothetical protein
MGDWFSFRRDVEVPLRVWAARRTVGQHVEPIRDGVTGRCADCPDWPDEVCPRLRRAFRTLLDTLAPPCSAVG